MHKGNADCYKHLMHIHAWKSKLRVMEIGMGSGMHIPSLINQMGIIFSARLLSNNN
jgi:hypothetical protein